MDSRFLDAGKPWGCLVSPNGDWASACLFASETELVQFLAQLEGQDIVAIPFYGTILPFTPGRQRYLILPDGEHALPIPVEPDDVPEPVSVDFIKSARQENFYFGHPALYGNGQEPDAVEGEVDNDKEEDG